MQQLRPVLEALHKDPVLNELYQKAYEKELQIQNQQQRGDI